jgi:hypothetical protein
VGAAGDKRIDRLLVLGVVGSVMVGLLLIGAVGVAIALIAIAFS